MPVSPATPDRGLLVYLGIMVSSWLRDGLDTHGRPANHDQGYIRMTLVIAVTGKRAIWLMTDRRLTDRSGKTEDTARKTLLLGTSDGCALLGYCGLGKTESGTEPGDWMARVLRGRNCPLE